MEDLLLRLTGLPHWQIALLTTYLLIQGVVVTIFPEEVIAVTLGMLWSQGKIPFFEAMLAMQAGLIPANALTVTLGHRLGRGFLRRRPFIWMLNLEEVELALEHFKKHGPWVIAITRFVPIIRGPVYFSVGLSHYGVFRFMRVDAIASCIQIPLLLLLGAWIGKNASTVIVAYQRIGLFMAVLIGGAIILKLFMDLRKKWARK